MKSMEFFLKFQRSYKNSTVENESLRRKLKDSEAAIAALHESYAQKESELLLSEGHIASLETQLSEDVSKAQSRIHKLEADLAVAHVESEGLLTGYSVLEEEIAQIKGKQAEIELQVQSLTSRLAMTQHKAVAQYDKAKLAVKLAFGLKKKFRRAKEQLRRDKVKARDLYKQLSFAS
jgi:chromosome segregation ATPase